MRNGRTGVSADVFKEIMAGFPAGVTVVTAYDGGGIPNGLTVSAFASVSADPQMALVCLEGSSKTLEAVLASRSLTVNFLSDAHEELAVRFASKALRKFVDLEYGSPEGGVGGPILLEGCYAHISRMMPAVVSSGTRSRTGKSIATASRPRSARRYGICGSATVSLFMPGASESARKRPGRVINCTAPDSDARNAKDPLVKSLLASENVRPGPLGLGFEADRVGKLICPAGSPWSFLYTLGTHRKGHLWETIAIPEIRGQASEIAASVLATDRSVRYRGSLAG